MAGPNMLESLPPELSIAILEVTPDVATLSALVHASPFFHAVYRANRERVLTKATLQEVGTKLRRVFGSWKVRVEVSFGHKVRLDFQPAVVSARARIHRGRKARVRLTVDQCISLRSTFRIQSWTMANRKSRPRIRFSEWLQKARIAVPVLRPPTELPGPERIEFREVWCFEWMYGMAVVLYR